MNASTPIFPLDAFGMAAPLASGSAAETGDDAFAETLAAALAASASTSVAPVKPETEPPARSIDAMAIAGQRNGGAAAPVPSATGTADPLNAAFPQLGGGDAPAGTRPSEPVMALKLDRPTEPAQSSQGGPASDLAGARETLANVAASDRAVLDGLRPLTPISAETTTATSLEIDARRWLERTAQARGGEPVSQGSVQPVTLAARGTASILASGPVYSAAATPHEPAVEAIIHPLNTDRPSVELTAAARLAEALPQERRRVQPGAAAAVTSAADGLRAAATSPATAFIDGGGPRPSLQTQAADPTRLSRQGAVDARDVAGQSDAALTSAGRPASEPMPPVNPAGERHVEAAARAPGSADVEVRLADSLEPAAPAESARRELRPEAAPAGSRGADDRQAQATALAGPAARAATADAGPAPNGDALGFERLQPVWSADGAATDVERLEPTAAAGPSRAQPAAAGHAPGVQIALQIMRALPGGVDRLSVHLQPAELGSVDIQLSFDAAGRLSALITAERPETLELLQRDGRLLERSLGDTGLKLSSDGLSFALKQDQQQQQQGQAFHDQAQNRQTTFLAGRAYDDASDAEQRPPALRIDGHRLLDIQT